MSMLGSHACLCVGRWGKGIPHNDLPITKRQVALSINIESILDANIHTVPATIDFDEY